MKSLILSLATAAALAASPGPGSADRHTSVCPAGPMSLTLEQDISTASNPSLAGRSFALELSMTPDPSGSTLRVTIDGIRATYVAHGMEQRLGTRQLLGRSFPLAAGEGGWAPAVGDSHDAPRIDLGPMTPQGLAVESLLAELLPAPPPVALEVGTTWTTERTVHSLEGWAWGTGRLSSRHRVVAVDRQPARTVIRVESHETAELAPDGEGTAYSGNLSRTVRWSFDAADRRLLSLSVEQESEGSSVLPPGPVELRQTTRIELAPRS